MTPDLPGSPQPYLLCWTCLLAQAWVRTGHWMEGSGLDTGQGWGDWAGSWVVCRLLSLYSNIITEGCLGPHLLIICTRT